jgi:long-chain acyl-CoA synthetase
MQVRSGDVVVCALLVRPEAAVTFVATALMGAIFLPVNPAWSEAELRWLITTVRPAAAVVQDRALWQRAGLAVDLILTPDQFPLPPDPVEDVVELPPGVTAAHMPPGHPVAFQLSSGSTGRPKIVVKSGAQFLQSMRTVAAFVGLEPGRRLLATTPFHFGFSFSWNLLLPLVSGATIVLLEIFEPSLAAEIIAFHRVDCLWGSPVLYNLLTDARLPAGSLSGLRLNFTGGAAISLSVKQEWLRLGAQPLRQAYGTTEAGMIAIQPEPWPPDGSVGIPPPDTELRILPIAEPASEPLPPGSIGEIAVRGPGVMTGYFEDPEATAALMKDGFLRTGDMGWLDELGRLYLKGRIRPWINAGGVKVDPVEVQNVLRSIPGVRDCVVQAEPGPRDMEIVAATIALEPGAFLTRSDVIRFCRPSLAEFKIPRVIRFVETLVTDITGKVSYNR